MNQLQREVNEREAALAESRRKLADAQHAEDVVNLQKIRADLKAEKGKLDDLKHKLDLAAVAVIHLQRQIEGVEIPAGPDQDAFAEQRRKALDSVQHLRAQMRDATIERDRLRLEALNAANHVEHLLRVERNLTTKAEGLQVDAGWKGSVTRV